MHPIKIILLLICVTRFSYAGFDSLFVKISGDTATVWHTKTMSNCVSKFVFEVAVKQDTVFVIERDTVGPLANCTCIFDLNVRLVNIWGYHTLMVYRQLLKKYFYTIDTTYFIGSISFTLPNPNVLPYFIIDKFQSKCGGIPVIVEKRDELIPVVVRLSNYPNPFNPTTKIEYQISTPSFVTVKIFDLLGREIEILVEEKKEAGNYFVQWNASAHPSGMYFYQLDANGKRDVKKMLLVR